MARVALFVEQQFEDAECMYPFFRLKEAGHDVAVVGTEKKEYKGKHGYPIVATQAIADVVASDFDAVIVPGGWAPDFMRRTPGFAAFVADMNASGKIIAAICHGPWLLATADVIKDKELTCFFAIKDDVVNAGGKYVDAEVAVGENIITSRKPSDLPAFMKTILSTL